MARPFTTRAINATQPIAGGPLVVFSEDRPPPILGMLDPPQTRVRAQGGVPPLRDAANNIVRHQNGLQVSALPPPLPVAFPGVPADWELEMYMRIDPDVTYSEVNARMPPATPVWPNSFRNRLNMRMLRVRGQHGARSWGWRSAATMTRRVLEVVRRLSQAQLDENTTWVVTGTGIHREYRALSVPMFNCSDLHAAPGNPNLVFPLGTFLEHANVPHVPSPDVQNALNVLAAGNPPAANAVANPPNAPVSD